MPKFLWKGKDSAGKNGVARIEAENAAAARAALTAEGWTDLRLQTDELMDFAGKSVEAEDLERLLASDCLELYGEVTPEEELGYLHGKQHNVLWQWMVDLWRHKFSTICLIALLYWGWRTGTKTPMFIAGGGLLIFIPLYLWFSISSYYYEKLLRARTWGRWQEVLTCTRRLAWSRKWTLLGLGKFELARSRALALTGLGNHEDGVRDFTRTCEAQNIPKWIFHTHLAAIYDVAKKYEDALTLRRKSAEEMPDISATWIDITYSLVRWLNRPAEARAALQKAESLELTEIARTYVKFMRGLIAWREGAFEPAKKSLEEALAEFRRLPHNGLVPGLILLVKSHLAVVHGALGELSQAKKYFAETEIFLIANREDELLKLCRTSLGRHHVPA